MGAPPPQNVGLIYEYVDGKKKILYLLQADRGCAAGAIFLGAGGVGVLV